jgi:hypothetical protein
MNEYIDLREPPPNRVAYCEGDKEEHLTEAGLMIAFAMHLLATGATAVELHPDGEHGKRHDIKATLERLGFNLMDAHGKTSYGGLYRRGGQAINVTLRPGQGDVVANIADQVVVAECKGVHNIRWM